MGVFFCVGVCTNIDVGMFFECCGIMQNEIVVGIRDGGDGYIKRDAD